MRESFSQALAQRMQFTISRFFSAGLFKLARYGKGHLPRSAVQEFMRVRIADEPARFLRDEAAAED